MKPTELKSLLTSRFKAGIKRPIHIESSPGLGKTQICRQIADELGVAFRIIHAPLMQPEDYGFPVISADRSNVDFVVAKGKFPLTGDTTCPDTGILCIDELPQTDQAGQKILANLIQEKEIHGKTIKKGWMVITTGNRASDRAGANRLLSHLGGRVTRIDLDASLDDWSQWAIANDVKPEVISFVRFRPELLNNFNPQVETNPTPRAWVEGVSAALGVVDPSLEFPVFKGDVGEGAAAEFTAFLKIYRKLPSPEAILQEPDSVEVPNDPATLYALCGALAARTVKTDFGNAMKYVQRMPAEFSVLFVRDAIRRKPEVQSCVEFIKWAAGPGAKLLT